MSAQDPTCRRCNRPLLVCWSGKDSAAEWVEQMTWIVVFCWHSRGVPSFLWLHHLFPDHHFAPRKLLNRRGLIWKDVCSKHEWVRRDILHPDCLQPSCLWAFKLADGFILPTFPCNIKPLCSLCPPCPLLDISRAARDLDHGNWLVKLRYQMICWPERPVTLSLALGATVDLVAVPVDWWC